MSDLGDVDDKADVKKYGDDFLFSWIFAKVFAHDMSESLQLNWYKHGVIPYGIAVRFDNENYHPYSYYY